jgi:hypothetical protein
MALSAGAVTAAAVGQLGPPAVASAHGGRTRVVDRRLAGPVGRAYDYLDVVMDAYGQTDDLRLLQSYHNESGLMTAAFIYDNSLAAIAYLSRSTPADVRRAKLIGDTLLWIQANDESFSDGRVRQAYAAGPMVFYGGSPEFPGLERADGKAAFLWPFGFSGSSVGDLAWAALALAQLYGHTRDRRYLDGAVALGDWIRGRRSPHRFGGFHGGVQGDGVTAQRWCSTCWPGTPRTGRGGTTPRWRASSSGRCGTGTAGTSGPAPREPARTTIQMRSTWLCCRRT